MKNVQITYFVLNSISITVLFDVFTQINGSLFHQTSLFIFQLSEMTADLGEEHSAATLATERLEVEQAERMKLQKDNSELQVILCPWLEYTEINRKQYNRSKERYLY